MILNSKVTWGLAWTGLAVVLAVPSADFLTGKLGGNKAAVITSTTEPAAGVTAPVQTSSVTTTLTKNGVTITPNAPVVASTSTAPADPVDKLLKSGKPLPDYISDGSAPTLTATTKTDGGTTQVASIDPAPVLVAPTPFPRPAVIDEPQTFKPAITKPVVTEAKLTQTTVTSPADPVVIVDENSVDNTIVTGSTGGPIPPEPIVDDSANWRTKGLAQYLDRQGLLADGASDSRSSASVTYVNPPPADYDPDGFYLSDGPNNDRAARRARLLQLFGDEEPPVPPASFNLF